jgi:hypothetical protein
MAVTPFINIFRTQEEAFYFKNSQINTQFIFKGVQLLPNNSAKYIQVTATPEGIDLEDWTVKAIDLCKGTSTDITQYFFVDSITNDLDGAPQLYWSLTNVPFDFGYRLIYLEITQAVGETFYSNPFLLTDIESEKTTQFHYKESKESVYQSVSLQTWFLDEDKKTELTTYYEVSTKNTVTQAIKTSYLHKFRTELMPKSVLIGLTYLLESPVLYVNYIRCSLFAAIDLPEKVAQENFATFDYNLSPNFNDNFFGLPDYSGIDYGSADYNTDVVEAITPTKIHNNVYSDVYN